MQVIGFVFLILGTFVYNDLVVTTLLRKWGWMKPVVRPVPAGRDAPVFLVLCTLPSTRWGCSSPCAAPCNPSPPSARGKDAASGQPERIIDVLFVTRRPRVVYFYLLFSRCMKRIPSLQLFIKTTITTTTVGNSGVGWLPATAGERVAQRQARR